MSTRAASRTRRRRSSSVLETGQTPMQPVEKPILCKPYEEPSEYWLYDQETGEASRAPGRRPAGHWFKTDRSISDQQGRLLAEENWEELPHVNRLREDVKRWRDSGYRNATNVTRQLLRHWRREDKIRRLFFCQVEAVETADLHRGDTHGRQADEPSGHALRTPILPSWLTLLRTRTFRR